VQSVVVLLLGVNTHKRARTHTLSVHFTVPLWDRLAKINCCTPSHIYHCSTFGQVGLCLHNSDMTAKGFISTRRDYKKKTTHAVHRLAIGSCEIKTEPSDSAVKIAVRFPSASANPAGTGLRAPAAGGGPCRLARLTAS